MAYLQCAWNINSLFGISTNDVYYNGVSIFSYLRLSIFDPPAEIVIKNHKQQQWD